MNPPRQKLRQPRPLTAREAALKAFLAMEADGAALDTVLSSQPGYKAMEARDRAFARAILAAAIRRRGTLEAAFNTFLDKPLRPREVFGRAVLTLGSAELLVLMTPPHAVVDGWVRITGAAEEGRRLKGLVNAVLRRVSERGADAFASAEPLLDLPEWLRARWVENYGEETVRAMALARAGAPPLDLSTKPDFDATAFASEIDGVALPTGTVRKDGIGDVTALPGFEAGNWWAQDAAAALPVKLLAPKEGERIADICAAPGGKTLQLAAAGADVIAVDRSETRLKRVTQNLARTGLKAEIITADATRWQPDSKLDAVLLDAPCSATGTLRRRPDVAWTKGAEDIASLAALQASLLDNAFAMLKPGGRLVYCTCSLEPEEGEDQIAAFLARTPKARREPVSAEELPGLGEAITPEGDVRTRPDMWAENGGLDGFFIARLVRVK
ncbi:MAG: methyltransferase domain-containing protein [Oceanicaulis sp.]|uniref:RsmB/NOP family class I SAM-dependent RNA methyltransferase n=1 Tax=Glycocaulis sp. TaxID=1969725 RepID=UPI0025C39E9F|nr:transcription antitermination factor NusB [Glycocaulis sp.]MCC5980686.1 methyltransferase domain-containing protein [Oceanicaulis sp.]MCH8520857.1 methyltransferase domain-containing protein [Glycocaulis sp.]